MPLMWTLTEPLVAGPVTSCGHFGHPCEHAGQWEGSVILQASGMARSLS
jgi:hypothetical protein